MDFARRFARPSQNRPATPAGRAPLVSLFLVACLALLAAEAGARTAPAKLLELESIFDGSYAAIEPSQIRWAPDGRVSYFLAAETGEEGAESSDAESSDAESSDAGDGRDLWLADPATGSKAILLTAQVLREMAPSPTQAGISERERTRRGRFVVPAYLWSPDSRSILFTSSGRLLLYDLEKKQVKTLAPSMTGVVDPKFAPGGDAVAFVYDHDLWLVPTAGGEARRLTRGGHELLLHGDLDWVYPEEFRVRTGYHFSPDGAYIAFLELDESPVPTYPIADLSGWQATVDLQRYPKPGDPNPRARVGIVALETGRTVWLDRLAEYVPRIDWVDGERVVVQLLNRGQDDLELVVADAATGRSRPILRERDDYWVDVTNDLRFLGDGRRFLWSSARSGLRHLYLYDLESGDPLRQLTAGDFRVSRVAEVDEAAGWVYYVANEDNVLGADLYRIRLDGTGKERLTAGRGTHRIDMSPKATAYVDLFASLALAEPRRQTVHDLKTGRSLELFREPLLEDHALVQPQLGEIRTADGALVRYLLLEPRRLEPGKRYPLVVYVYGMAGFPTIRDVWSNHRRSLFHQFLVQRGYVVAYVDDRSSSIPGHRYAALADRAIGPVAAADVETAVQHLGTLPHVDADRVAVWGWSGGGFTTAYLLGHSERFKVGVAGAPVTDWRLYDSIYTERYMGHPEDEPEAYERTSALAGAETLHGRLLLIHGTHDDNVHPQNTLRMVDALIRAGKRFDLMLYPGKTHGITGKDHRLHLYTLIYEYLERHL